MTQDRKRLRRSLAVAAVLLALLGAGALWWIYPGPTLPPLLAVAFDDVCLPGAEAHVRLQVEPLEAKTPFPTNLAGFKVVFRDVNRPGPPLARLVTDRNGQAQAAVHFTGPTAQALFTAGLEASRQVRFDQGRMFFLPSGTVLVLVDVQDLFADPALDLTTKDLNQVAVHQPAVKLLHALHAQKKQIVYLALRSDTARGYYQARRWVAAQSEALPSGPVLGRPSYHDAKTADDARQQIGSDLAHRWQATPFVRP